MSNIKLRGAVSLCGSWLANWLIKKIQNGTVHEAHLAESVEPEMHDFRLLITCTRMYKYFCEMELTPIDHQNSLRASVTPLPALLITTTPRRSVLTLGHRYVRSCE
jgi:hypothetical protein